MSSKYDSSQEIRIGTRESSVVCKLEVPKFVVRKRGANLGCDGGGHCLVKGKPLCQYRGIGIEVFLRLNNMK